MAYGLHPAANRRKTQFLLAPVCLYLKNHFQIFFLTLFLEPTYLYLRYTFIINNMKDNSKHWSVDYRKIDLTVVYLANLINIFIAFLFLARMSGLTEIENTFGISTIAMGFVLGYIAYINKKNHRDKWETYLLIPIFLFMIIELLLDYILIVDFRSTSIAGPYVLLYYIGAWGLIGYSFRFEKKWGFITLGTYFIMMILTIYPYVFD
jgi:hypothetical protein